MDKMFSFSRTIPLHYVHYSRNREIYQKPVYKINTIKGTQVKSNIKTPEICCQIDIREFF